MTKYPQFHGRTSQHIDIKYHFIRERVGNGVVQLKDCPTEHVIADMFRKLFPQDKFAKLIHVAGVRAMPSCKEECWKNTYNYNTVLYRPRDIIVLCTLTKVVCSFIYVFCVCN